VPLWFVQQNYAVILEKRAGYFLLVTTFCLKPYQVRKSRREWEEWNAPKSRDRQ
jgi:hypothetical protein